MALQALEYDIPVDLLLRILRYDGETWDILQDPEVTRFSTTIESPLTFALDCVIPWIKPKPILWRL